MSQKLRFGTRERRNYRSGVVCRRTSLSYDEVIRRDNEHAHADYMRQYGLQNAMRRLQREKVGG